MDVYKAPASNETVGDVSTCRDITLGWEKRRIRYNLILLPLGIFVLILWSYQDTSQLLFLIPGSILFGIGANLCYLLGPLGELYLKAFFPKLNPRPFLYWAGVILSALVILGCGLLGWLASLTLIPDQQ